MVAIVLPECGGGGCSRVEHQRMGASLRREFLVRPSFVGVWNGLVGWFEVETRYWVVRLHAPSAVLLLWGSGGGVWLVLPGHCAALVVWWLVWGCFLRTA